MPSVRVRVLIVALSAWLSLSQTGFSADFPPTSMGSFEPDTGMVTARPSRSGPGPIAELGSAPFSSSMFPWLGSLIPNLQLGFLYNVGPNIRTGRFTADYLLPIRVGKGSVFFGEAHCESQDFWKRASAAAEYRVDVSLGGGFRKLLNGNSFLGVNGFYDTTKVFGQWYSSGGYGLEMAAVIGGDAALDLNFNYYGDIFNRDLLVNAFRNGGGSYDVEAGYSQSLFNQALDLRLKVVGYQFDTGEKVYGWRTGGDVTTKNGMFTIRYEHGHDRIAGPYDTIGGFVNVGLQLDNLFSLESPFTSPEPVYKSPRNLAWMLTQHVHRNWHLPSSVVLARSSNSWTANASKKPFFKFSISDPLPNSVIRNQIVGETHTVIQVTPGWASCPSVFFASTQSLTVENSSSSAPVNVRATVITDRSVPGGCDRVLRVQLPTGLLLGSIGAGFPATGDFVLPAGGRTWSFGAFAVLAYYRVPCDCGAPISSGALVGTLVLEDLSGQIPTQVIDVITVP